MSRTVRCRHYLQGGMIKCTIDGRMVGELTYRYDWGVGSDAGWAEPSFMAKCHGRLGESTSATLSITVMPNLSSHADWKHFPSGYVLLFQRTT